MIPRAHLAGRDDGLVRVAPLIGRVGRFVDLIGLETGQIPFAAPRAAESTGRPLGCDDFVAELARLTGRYLRPKMPGRKSRERAEQLEFGLSDMGKVSPVSPARCQIQTWQAPKLLLLWSARPVVGCAVTVRLRFGGSDLEAKIC